MKAFLWLTLLSLVTIAYGATITPKVALDKPALSKDDEAAAVLKAGKSMQTLGRFLQDDQALTKEQQEEVLEVLNALTSAEGALSNEDAEYFFQLIIRGVISGAVSQGVRKLFEKFG
uniref:Putative secreted protein n=1 Tax=Amblyomma cajennense TaxID=34607 RepID=A0A023FBU9_AMBCJ